jgi:hypothetical protein
VGRYRFVAVAVAVAGVCGALAPGAWTAPSTPRTVTFVLENCEGPAGTPTTLTGVKQPSEGAALHLTIGGKYILMEAFPTGDPDNPFFTTPGFDHNNLALVTCTVGETTVKGLITPVR